ncbi:hypothetical protein V8C35DRAFT_287051 [Trichoderma chlorosporum]
MCLLSTYEVYFFFQYRYISLPVEAYWKQASNMTEAGQREYRQLLIAETFIVKGAALKAPSSHAFYKDVDLNPTWAKIRLPAIDVRQGA